MLPAAKLIAPFGFMIILYFQLDKLTNQESWKNLFVKLSESSTLWPLVLSGLFLTIVNYILEAYKWRTLLSKVGQFSFLNAIASVTCGILFAIFTPARLGEYGGRIILLPKQLRLKGISLMLVSSVAQNLSIVILGAVSFLFLLDKYFHFSDSVSLSSGVLLLVSIVCGLFFYFNLSVLTVLGRKLRLPTRFNNMLTQFSVVSDYHRSELVYVLIISVLRVFVWAILYILIICLITGSSFNFWYFPAVFCIFLLQTGLPMPPITGIIARGSIAIFIWNFYGISEWEALFSTFILYFFNLLVPSFVGLSVLMTSNLNK